MVRSAVAQKLTIIGEGRGGESPPLPEIERPRSPGLRSSSSAIILVRAYFGLDWEEVWRAAKHRCPVLRDQIARLLQDMSET